MYILHHITYGIILHITSLRIRHELKDMEKTCPARSYWHHVGMQKKQKKSLVTFGFALAQGFLRFLR